MPIPIAYGSTKPSTPSSSLAPGPLLLIGLIVLAALSRLLPHPPNVSPVEAIALFGGALIGSLSTRLKYITGYDGTPVPVTATFIMSFAIHEGPR